MAPSVKSFNLLPSSSPAEIANYANRHGGASVRLQANGGLVLMPAGSELSERMFTIGGTRGAGGMLIPEVHLTVERLTASHVELFADFVRDHLASAIHGGHGIGFWVENGKFVCDGIDFVIGRESAIELGKQRGERAIFDLHNSETIYLNDDNDELVGA